MTVFGVDSAGKNAGVAIMRDGALLYEATLCAGLTHSETLLALCDAAFAATGLGPKDVELYAVNAGPGSFTGLRIGLSCVKGLAFAQDTPCKGVSTLAALAHSMPLEGAVLCALDARRGEVYHALFRVKAGRVERLSPDESGSAAGLDGLLAGLDGPIHLLGDGAALVQAALGERFPLRLTQERFRLGRAAGVCAAALAEGEAVPPARLVPEYHRLSQAQRERAARLAQQGKDERS